MAEAIDLLSRPVYGMAQVDRILGLRTGTAERWIDGYERSGRFYPPVVRVAPTGSDTVTWGEFSEARLLSEYRNAGASMFRMRPAVDALRQRLGVPYPLAQAAVWLQPDGRELVERVQNEVNLDRQLMLVVVRNGQLTLALPAERFVESVEWEKGIAGRIHPVPNLQHVVFDPLRQFGEPVVRSVPTAVIAEQYRAGDSIGFIADAYQLTEEQVEQAIRYEFVRRGGPAPQAA